MSWVYGLLLVILLKIWAGFCEALKWAHSLEIKFDDSLGLSIILEILVSDEGIVCMILFEQMCKKREPVSPEFLPKNLRAIL